MNEADTCRKYVVPKLQAAGWENEPHSLTEQKFFTDGRISTSACLSQLRIKLSARSRSFDTWPTLRPPPRTSFTVSALNSRVKIRRARFCLDMGPLFYAHATERGCPRNRVNASYLLVLAAPEFSPGCPHPWGSSP